VHLEADFRRQDAADAAMGRRGIRGRDLACFERDDVLVFHGGGERVARHPRLCRRNRVVHGRILEVGKRLRMSLRGTRKGPGNCTQDSAVGGTHEHTPWRSAVCNLSALDSRRSRMFKAVLLSLAVAASAAAQTPPTKSTEAPPDNTKVNRAGEVNASSQKNGKHDLAITRDIRKAIVSDKSLSTYAHNVKVITSNGFVTLKGPVR